MSRVDELNAFGCIWLKNDLVLVDKNCMVAERYLASVYQRFPTPARIRSKAMAIPYLRGVEVITGGAFMRSASAGAILVGVTGQATLNTIDSIGGRAKVWCQQRRGRQQTHMSSQQLSPMAFSIHSHFSDSQTEQKKWKE